MHRYQDLRSEPLAAAAFNAETATPKPQRRKRHAESALGARPLALHWVLSQHRKCGGSDERERAINKTPKVDDPNVAITSCLG
jgi:hypothetical protein